MAEHLKIDFIYLVIATCNLWFLLLFSKLCFILQKKQKKQNISFTRFPRKFSKAESIMSSYLLRRGHLISLNLDDQDREMAQATGTGYLFLYLLVLLLAKEEAFYILKEDIKLSYTCWCPVKQCVEAKEGWVWGFFLSSLIIQVLLRGLKMWRTFTRTAVLRRCLAWQVTAFGKFLETIKW